MLGQPAALRFRLAYGFVSSIKITESKDAGSPFGAPVILRVPFRYGDSPFEAENSCLYCRVNAFASCDYLPSSAQAVRIGMPVCGVVSKSSLDYHTAQLVGWDPTTASDWKLLSPDACPRVGLSCLPMTFTACLKYFRVNHPPGKIFSIYLLPSSPFAQNFCCFEPSTLSPPRCSAVA